MLKTEFKVAYTRSDSEKQKIRVVKGEKIPCLTAIVPRTISLKLNTKLNFFPQESNKIGFVFTGKTHTQKKKVFLEFWDTSRWLHFDLLLVQMHFYTTSVS